MIFLNKNFNNIFQYSHIFDLYKTIKYKTYLAPPRKYYVFEVQPISPTHILTLLMMTGARLPAKSISTRSGQSILSQKY